MFWFGRVSSCFIFDLIAWRPLCGTPILYVFEIDRLGITDVLFTVQLLPFCVTLFCVKAQHPAGMIVDHG